MTHEPDTALWPAEDYRLWIRVGSTGLTAHLLPKEQGEQLQIASIKWQPDRKQALRRIEDAVYEEHLPIDIYDTEIEVDPERMLVAPTAAVYDEDVPQDMYDMMYKPAGSKGDDVLCQQCGDVCFIYGLPRGLQGFLERTFGTATIGCSLAKRYNDLVAKAEAGQHMHVFIRPDRIDVVAFSGHNLLLANTFSYTEAADLKYYILNAWQTAGLSQLQGYLHLHPVDGTDIATMNIGLAEYINHIEVSD